MKRACPAITPEDKKKWAALKAMTPRETPTGWESPTNAPTRVNDHDKPGVFLRIYTNGYLKLAFMCLANGIVQVTLSHLNGVAPLPEHVELVKRDFFADRVVEASSPVSGLVYFGFSK